MLQTRIAAFSFLIVTSLIVNFLKIFPFSTLAAFFLKASAQQEATEIMCGDEIVALAILQIKRKEWTTGRLNKKIESDAASAEDLFWGFFLLNLVQF